jgi:hypothetical protein
MREKVPLPGQVPGSPLFGSSAYQSVNNPLFKLDIGCPYWTISFPNDAGYRVAFFPSLLISYESVALVGKKNPI